MGFFDKLKNFGSKIVRGIRRGYEWVRDKVAPVVRKVLPVVQTVGPAVATAVGHPEVGQGIAKGTQIADKVLRFMGK